MNAESGNLKIGINMKKRSEDVDAADLFAGKAAISKAFRLGPRNPNKFSIKFRRFASNVYST